MLLKEKQLLVIAISRRHYIVPYHGWARYGRRDFLLDTPPIKKHDYRMNFVENSG
jgi:hypothetical protein